LFFGKNSTSSGSSSTFVFGFVSWSFKGKPWNSSICWTVQVFETNQISLLHFSCWLLSSRCCAEPRIVSYC
jgi:hypothetical protein